MKNIVIVSHCVLNSRSKGKRYDNITREIDISNKGFIEFLLNEEIGIIQLPCPESYCYGLNRYRHTKNQFDDPEYRDGCKTLFEPTLKQILGYEDAGYNVLAIIGISGSPSCGVENVSVDHVEGEFSENPNLRRMIDNAKKTKETGIFIDEINKELHKNNLDIAILEYDPLYTDELIKKILDLKSNKSEDDIGNIIKLSL